MTIPKPTLDAGLERGRLPQSQPARLAASQACKASHRRLPSLHLCGHAGFLAQQVLRPRPLMPRALLFNN